MLNDTQFLEAYRKLAERAIKSSANEDEQLITMWRLALRRHPDAAELATMKAYRASEVARMQESPDDAKKLIAIRLTADRHVDFPRWLPRPPHVTPRPPATPRPHTPRSPATSV